jgi:hypothetical protein
MRYLMVGENCMLRSFVTRYASPNVIRVIKTWAGHEAGMGEMHNKLVGKHERKQLLRRPRHRWEDNIRMELWERGW